MNTKIIGIIVLLLIVVGAIALVMSTETSDSQTGSTDGAMMMEKDTAINENQNNDAMMKKDDSSMQEVSGTYTTYSPDKLALAENGDVVLFFKASWCPSCRTLDSDIKSNVSNIPAEVTILEVDYDTSTELKQKYGVTTQHTLVQVDASGNLIKKWSGGSTLMATLEQII